MGGQNVPCNCLGGVERRKVGLGWSVPVSSKEDDRAWTNGRGGGNVS